MFIILMMVIILWLYTYVNCIKYTQFTVCQLFLNKAVHFLLLFNTHLAYGNRGQER